MRFQVFKDGKIVEKFRLHGAYVFGTDGIAVCHTNISFKNGMVECSKANLGTVGLALVWPVEDFGLVLLPTTTLPERNEPYNLNVEIARAKLMQIIIKREDWGLFDDLEELEKPITEAKRFFVQAIQHISEPAKASRLADKSLKKSVLASERLALKEAEILFDSRGNNNGLKQGSLGCRVDPARINDEGYIEKLSALFDFAMIGINWAQIETSKGNYDFLRIDACIQVLGRNKMLIGAGPLLHFSKESLPDWLLKRGTDFELIREAAYRFVSTAVNRYTNQVALWRVISGLNAFNHFGFSFEQILEMTRAANMASRQPACKAVKVVEIANLWGEYYATRKNTIPPLVYMDMIVQGAINFDALGVQMRFGRDVEGMHVRDMMQISAALDYFAAIAKPLYITAVEVPGEHSGGDGSPEGSGRWHGDWDSVRQGQWIEQFYKIAFSKPFVNRVTYSNLADGPGCTMAKSGLLTEQLNPKQAYQKLSKLRKQILGT